MAKSPILVSRSGESQWAESAEPVSMAPDEGPYDLISLWAVVQSLKIDILPGSWQKGLEEHGATAQLYQSLVLKDFSVVFKRYAFRDADPRREDRLFRHMITELTILGCEPIAEHPNIVNIRGISWDINLADGQPRAYPTLVLDKADYGDLGHFLSSDRGKAISFSERIDLCVDIGCALKSMHDCHIIHGDLKPGNILVFQKSTEISGVVAKVTDFGYSTLFSGSGLITLSKTPPWNAPEQWRVQFPFEEAKKADFWSYGLLCFWILFHDRSEFPELEDNLTFKRLIRKLVDKYLNTSDMSSLTSQQQTVFRSIISASLDFEPRKRNKDLVEFLTVLRGELPPSEKSPVTNGKNYLEHKFSIVSSLHGVLLSDYRLSQCIFQSAQQLLERDPYFLAPRTRDTSFELAICSAMGVGCLQDRQKAQEYLTFSARGEDELQSELARATATSFPKTSRRYDDINFQTDLHPLQAADSFFRHPNLRDMRKAYENLLPVLADTLGENHSTIIILRIFLIELCNDQGDRHEAEKLCQRNIDAATVTLGDKDNITIYCIESLARLYCDRGNLEAAEKLVIDSLTRSSRTHSNPGPFSKIIGEVYVQQRRWDDADKHWRRILRQTEEVKGLDHPLTLDALLEISAIARCRGDLVEVAKVGTRLYATTERVQESADPHTIDVMANHAATLIEQGQLDDALRLEESIFESNKRSRGRGHPDTLRSQANLGYVYSIMGRYEDAQTLEEEVLAERKLLLGPSHLATIMSMKNLGGTLRKSGQLVKAEKCLSEAERLAISTLGAEHPTTLQCMHALLLLYLDQQLCAKAVEKGTLVLEAWIAKFGEHDMDTVNISMTLAIAHAACSQYQEAQHLLESTGNSREDRLGLRDSKTLRSKSCLAQIFMDQGNLDDGLKLLEEVVAVFREMYSPKSLELLREEGHLACRYEDVGQHSAAEKLQRRVVEDLTSTVTIRNPLTLRSKYNLADMLSRKPERVGEAEELFLEVLQGQKEILDFNHPNLIETMSSLCLLYKKNKNWSSMKSIASAILDRRADPSRADYPDILEAVSNLALANQMTGEKDVAEMLYIEAAQLQRRHGGHHGKGLLRTLTRMSAFYMDCDDWNKVVKALIEVVTIQKSTAGKHDPKTLVKMNWLAVVYLRLKKFKAAQRVYEEMLSYSGDGIKNIDEFTIGYVESLASILRRRKLWKESASMYKCALEYYGKVGGDEESRIRREEDLEHVCEMMSGSRV